MVIVNTIWKDKFYVLKFFLAFVFCMMVFYGFYYSIFFQDYFHKPILHLQTKIGATLLGLLGFMVQVSGDEMSSMNILIKVSGGCDGIEASALFLAAVLLFPIPFKFKWQGILWGVIVLSILNILRIVGLFLTAYYYPDWFDFMHTQGGLYVFSFVTILILIIWSDWALKGYKADLEQKGAI